MISFYTIFEHKNRFSLVFLNVDSLMNIFSLFLLLGLVSPSVPFTDNCSVIYYNNYIYNCIDK